MTPAPDGSESRLSQRRNIAVRVDVKPLKTVDVDHILYGDGFQDLNLNSLSLSRPRHGMERARTLDLSVSGLRISGADLKPGTAAVLDIHLPEERVVIKALAEVVWVRHEDAVPHAGLRFAAMQQQSAVRMREYLNGTSLN